MDTINYNLLLDNDNFNTFDLKLTTDAILDFNKGSLTPGSVTDNLLFYYNFQNYNNINNIYSLINYSGRTCTGVTLNDIGLTGIDNGYVYNLTGETITFTSASTFSIKPVTGHTDSYNLSLVTDNTSTTQVLSLNGGFYQGFYKLHNYSYEMLPNRTQKGITLNFWLNHNESGVTTNGLVSDEFFFFMGSRAENKFHHIFSGETGITTTTNVLLSSQTGVTSDVSGFGLYFNSGGSIGVKQIITRQDESGNTTVSIFQTGTTFLQSPENPWVNLCVTFTRDESLSFCDDCGCLIPEAIILTEYSSGCTQDAPRTQTGVLRFFINARPIASFHIEEPIFRALSIDKDVQQGVPYNISIGGGTQGLYETVTFGGIDPSDENLFMYENFGGSFKGKMGLAAMYSVPLSIPEIIRNFYDLKSIYKIEETFGGAEIITNPYLVQ